MIRVERDIETSCHECGEIVVVGECFELPWCSLCDVWLCDDCRQNHQTGGERIHAVAIKNVNTIYTLPRPARHWNVLALMHEEGVHSSLGDQGFLTDTGRWVSRRAAWGIAMHAGQIIRDVGCPGTLYSENVW